MSKHNEFRTSSWVRRVSWQLAGVLAASVVLGFAFNASSPVGVRFNESDTTSLAATTAPTRPTLQLPSTPPGATITNRVVIPPPSPPLPVEKPAHRLRL